MTFKLNPFSGKLEPSIDPFLQSGAVRHEPTGFEHPDNWTVEYDPTTQTVTLTPTGTERVYVQGRGFVFSAPLTLSHTNATGTYFFEFDNTGALTVGTTPFDFENKAQAAIVYYDTTQTPLGWALRENHGLVMDWATHQEFHEKDGTYLVSGGGLTAGSYTVYDPGDSDNPLLATIAPEVPSTVVADEDLRTTLAAWTTPYVKFSFDWIALGWSWVEDSDAPYFQTGNVPYYNPSSGGASLVALSNDDYCCYYLFGVPTADDATSQEFRHIWIPGQVAYSPSGPNTAARTIARDLALAEDPQISLLLTTLPSAEFVPLAKLVVHYRTTFTNNDYRLRIEGYQKLLGSRSSFGGSGTISLPVYVDSSIGITTAAAVGGLDPTVETNQKLVNERYAAYGYIGAWVTGSDYRIGNVVKVDHKLFCCLVAHTAAASFYTDLNAGNWELSASGGLAGKITTTDATVTTIASTTIPTDVSCKISIKVSAFEPATGDTRSWELEYHIQNDSGTASVQLIAERGYEVAGSTTWAAIADVSGTTFRIRVTGEAAHTIDWNTICEHSYF